MEGGVRGEAAAGGDEGGVRKRIRRYLAGGEEVEREWRREEVGAARVGGEGGEEREEDGMSGKQEREGGVKRAMWSIWRCW